MEIVAFEDLPLVIVGESKEVRYLGRGAVAIRFRPTVYSFTVNRGDVVPGSDRIRLETSRVFLEVLRRAGIRHAYEEVDLEQGLVRSRLVMPADSEFAKYGLPVFVPPDLRPAEIDALPRAPAVEVIVKNAHTGSSKHRYHRCVGSTVRRSHPTLAGARVEAEQSYPEPIVRFDWRNPLVHPDTGARLADEILPEPFADWFLDVEQARRTALRVNRALVEFLEPRHVDLCDLCLFIAEDGELVYGEVSPDCGRFRHRSLGSLDKDIWRAGGSSGQVLEKWRLLARHVTSSPA